MRAYPGAVGLLVLDADDAEADRVSQALVIWTRTPGQQGDGRSALGEGDPRQAGEAVPRVSAGVVTAGVVTCRS